MKQKWIVVVIGLILAVSVWGNRKEGRIAGAVTAQDCNLLKKGDLDCDGKITVADFAIWKMNFLSFIEEPGVTTAPSPTTKPECQERPVCLDAKLPCMIAEPVGGWCPVPTAVSAGSCGWCGNQCVIKTAGMACLDVMPPVGQTCSEVGGKCLIGPPVKVTLVPTVVSAGSCGWCGSSCTRVTDKMMCADVLPPVGKSCVEAGGVCTVIDGGGPVLD